MQTTEILSALAELSQRLYDEAIEARGMRELMKHDGRHHEAKVHNTRIDALVEFDNALSRIITKAQKADVGQTLDGGSLQRAGRLCALWREEAAQMDQIAEEEGDDESKMAVECRERSLALRDCADALQREWEGTEPTEKLTDRLGETL